MLQSVTNSLSSWGSNVAERYRLGDVRLANWEALKAHRKYATSHESKDLDHAITKGKEAAQKMPPDHPDRCLLLYNVSQYFESRYKATGGFEDLNRSVFYALDALKSVPKGHAKQVRLNSNAAMLLQDRYDVTRRIEDLALAISKYEEAALSALDEYSDRAVRYHNWSLALSARYTALRQPEDLNRCISNYQVIVGKLTTSSPTDRIKFLIKLASFLAQRFDNDGELQDITDAIKAATEIVTLARPSHPELANWLNYLALYYSKRFDRTEKADDVNEAIRYGMEAMKWTSKDDVVSMAERASSLSLCYCHRFYWVGEVDEIQLAVILGRKALGLLPPKHAQRRKVVFNLASCLRARYLRLGGVEDLEEAISKGHEAVKLTPSEEVKDLRRYQSNLSLDLHSRYNRIGAVKDLEQAIRIVRKAIEIEPDDPALLNNLLIFLGHRWDRFGQQSDVDEAIQLGQRARAVIPLESDKRFITMGNLAVALRRRFESLQRIEDLEEAIRICLEMVDSSSPRSDPSHALNVLSSCLLLRYRKLNVKEDLESALATRSKTLTLMPNDHPNRAFALVSLLQMRLAQFDASGDQCLLDSAIQEGKEAISMPNASFQARVVAGYWAGAIAMHGKRWVEGDEFFCQAIHLMPRLTPRSLTRDDQQFAITKLVSIASLAVSASIQAQKSVEESLETLEAGRGILASLTISSRNDVSDLDKVDPNLRLEYERLRDRVNALPSLINLETEMLEQSTSIDETLGRGAMKSATSSREDHTRELERLERRIRTFPGFARFQLSPAANDLIELAAEGPIVSFNVTTYRSDVFLVTRKDVRVLQLPSLKYSDLDENAVKLLGRGKLTVGKPRTKAARNKQLRTILQWIWDVAVGQVLQQLKLLSSEPRKQLPRIWWLTSGFLGSMPLHSAGYHGKGCTNNALHHVISSFVPSFRALKYARERRLQAAPKAIQRGLVVTMPKTAGMKDLDVQEEAHSVQEILSQLTVQAPSILETPSRQAVVDNLTESTIVHFACHGASDPYDPSNGGLYLQGGSLTIRDLGPISLPHAQIAYLSACSTAKNAALHLIEEAIQVATGFQLMGFPHVVGTFWEASNRAATRVAKGFYQNLAKQMSEGRGLIELGIVATALHDAVKTLMNEEGVEDAISWAPFIHIGA